MNNFKSQIRNTDIYLIDQILKGNFDNFKSVLDVGCGSGRNLHYFLENNFEVFGIDPNENRINEIKKLTNVKPDNFKIGSIETTLFNQKFDLIICNAVLHFARNQKHFEKMLQSMWNNLSAEGILFIRVASDIGIESFVNEIRDRVFVLGDSSTRFLVNQKMILDNTNKLNAKLIEPIKTTNVQNLRAMTTWVLKK